MLAFALRRAIWAIPTLFGVSLVVFLLTTLLPDPEADAAVAAGEVAARIRLDELRRARFLDLPRLVNVAPDGRAISLCDGIRADVGPQDGPVITVELGATANRFCAGHRIRLEVTSSNFPRFARHPNTGIPRLRAGPEDLVPATQCVHHDARRPSYLALPVRATRSP